MNVETFMVSAGKKVQDISGSIAVDTTGLATEAKQDATITAIQAIPGGGGVQYTEGDTDATITGTAMLGEAAGDALEPLQLDASNNLKVAVQGTVPVSGTFYQATQPVSGTVAVSNATFPVTDNAGSLTVDAPVATPVFVRLSDGAAAISTLPVSLASVPSHAVTNAGIFAVQSTNQANNGVDIGDVTINNAAGASAVNIQDGGNSITVDGAVTATLSAETTKVIGTVNVAAAQTIATTNAGTFAVQQSTYATSSVTSVAASITTVQLLASTAGRRGAYLYNDSTANCYLKLGTTASTSSFTIKMAGGGFYELPYPCYTGRIDGIWDSATGSMRVTELT